MQVKLRFSKWIIVAVCLLFLATVWAAGRYSGQWLASRYSARTGSAVLTLPYAEPRRARSAYADWLESLSGKDRLYVVGQLNKVNSVQRENPTPIGFSNNEEVTECECTIVSPPTLAGLVVVFACHDGKEWPAVRGLRRNEGLRFCIEADVLREGMLSVPETDSGANNEPIRATPIRFADMFDVAFSDTIQAADRRLP